MDKNHVRKSQSRLAAEDGLTPPAWGGRLSVALVYPNTYRHGMSNLGLQTVYGLLNRGEKTRCERFFLPEPGEIKEYQRSGMSLVSLETQRPVSDFDLVAFSISFENDYLNLPVLFDLMRLPLWSRERGSRYPLILCGGVCAFLNPEPLAEIMDLFAIGEAEVILPELCRALARDRTEDRNQLLAALAGLAGIYVPAGYRVDYHANGQSRYQPLPGFPPRVVRRYLDDLDAGPAMTCITTADTEFAGMTLVEVARGCPRACRFCAAGFIYRPFRQTSLDAIRSTLPAGDERAGRVGLVASAVTDYSSLAELGRELVGQGTEVSVSSVRIDAITPSQVAMLRDSGHKTLALAPEAGSQRMRNAINKGLDEAQILSAVEMIAEGGIPNLKLYFMIGLPGERAEDLEAIVDLSLRIRSVWERSGKRRGRLGRLTLSVNPFVPKPWTPLQWAPMEARASLDKKYRRLRARTQPVANLDLNCESLRSAELQGLFARGDRRVGALLPLLAAGRNLRAACRDEDLDPAFYLHRTRAEDELFPWEIIDQGVSRRYLREEYEQALASRLSGPCHAGCRRCGLAC